MKKKRRKRNKNKKQSMIVFVIIIIVTIILLFASGLIRFKTFENNLQCQVLLDAGHGGYDSGSVFNQYYEKDIALALTLEIGEQLENKGISVGYTRTQDKSLGSYENEDLKQRVSLANQSSATFFISIHTNASMSKNARGFEVWCNQNSYPLASIMNQQIDELAYIENRGIMDIRKKSLYLIRNSNKKTILIEAGFLESSLDREYLCNEMNRKAFAKEIAEAIEIALQQEGELGL